jgi:hypothetical protein
LNNLTGETYGSLTVLRPSNQRGSSGELLWECSCDCGRRVVYRASKISQGLRKSCGRCTEDERKPKSKDKLKHIRRSKGKLHFSKLPIKKQLFLINDFLFGGNYQELSDKYNVTLHTVRDGIKLYRERLNTIYEMNYMANIQNTSVSTETLQKALATSFVEQTLRDMLSDDQTEVLTDHEIMYCYLFVHTGSNEIALRESQLDTCLASKTPIRVQYLGMYLREKPNLKSYIQILQEDKLKDLKASKEIVQRELITQVEQLKEIVSTGSSTATDRSNLIRSIELLGKTCGAFEERVRVTKVSAADALDELLEMAKAEAVLLPESTGGEEVWEVANE